jgi:hypothetical protein
MLTAWCLVKQSDKCLPYKPSFILYSKLLTAKTLQAFGCVSYWRFYDKEGRQLDAENLLKLDVKTGLSFVIQVTSGSSWLLVSE